MTITMCIVFFFILFYLSSCSCTLVVVYMFRFIDITGNYSTPAYYTYHISMKTLEMHRLRSGWMTGLLLKKETVLLLFDFGV